MSCKCEHCNNTFSNKVNLRTHQTRAKYCLKIQGKLSDKIEKLCEFICDGCDKNFTRKHDFTRHVSICKKYSNNNLQKNKIYELESDIKILLSQMKSPPARAKGAEAGIIIARIPVIKSISVNLFCFIVC